VGGEGVTLVFLHTAEVHVGTFGALAAEIAPGVAVRHVVAAHLLDEARRDGGVSADLDRRARGELLAAAEEASVVLCTCSTFGPSADAAARASRVPILRLDRPMAEAAIEMGPRILVAACLETTLGATTDLLAAVAAEKQRQVSVDVLVVDGAWEKFERGEIDAYLDHIAAALTKAAAGHDVVVLAQASMAGVATRCASLGVPVLSSPRLGVESAVRAAAESAARAAAALTARGRGPGVGGR
jgi:hypothetical protein